MTSHDADNAPGVQLQAGDAVTWTYEVTNTGDVDLSNVEVGPYSNLGTATGTSPKGAPVRDTDPSHYTGARRPGEGRMTGGGSVFHGNDRFTHGFTLHCDTSEPNNLEINWGQGRGVNFHLTNLTSGHCSDNPSIDEGNPVAGFDTFEGSGTGRWNNVDGATITFTFTDAGEPGKSDIASFTIVSPDGSESVTVSGPLHNGNHQAHP